MQTGLPDPCAYPSHAGSPPGLPSPRLSARPGRPTHGRAAALLHDTLEDTDTTYDELRGVNPRLERAFDRLYRQRPDGRTAGPGRPRRLSRR